MALGAHPRAGGAPRAEAVRPALGNQVRATRKAAKRIQELLGEHQDTAVAAGRMMALAREQSDVVLALTCGRLAGRERAAVREHRRAFLATWPDLAPSSVRKEHREHEGERCSLRTAPVISRTGRRGVDGVAGLDPPGEASRGGTGLAAGLTRSPTGDPGASAAGGPPVQAVSYCGSGERGCRGDRDRHATGRR